MEERSERLAAEQHINNQLEGMVSIQSGLQTSIATIENFQKGMQQQMQLLNEQMQHNNRGKSILGEGPSMAAERGSNSNPGRNNVHSTTENNNSSYTPFPRVEFPHFDGDNPRAWILRCNRYFQVIPTIPEEHKVALASVYLDGKAEMWFQGFMEGRELPSWPQFTLAILERFDDYDPELIVGSFNKLNQIGTVSDYLERFEELKSHMLIFNKDLPEEFFSSSFVNGLKDDTRGVVMSMKPKDFHQAVTLAKKQEGAVDAIIKRTNLASKNFSQNKPAYRHIPSNHSQSRSPQIPPKPPFQNQSEPTQNHRKLLTASEMRARREKKLCYNCDETFVPDMNTLRIQGSVKGKDVHILIDSGSTHCFLDETTAHKLGCKLDYTSPMIVSVANGAKWVIKLGGCDMVLGGNWLRQNSPVEFDYHKMKLTITRNGKKLTISVITDNASLQLISAKSFSKIFKRKGAYGLIGHLFSVTATPLNAEPKKNRP
ncbi:hypothetical protein BUALT_Bualt14G0043900 [Buddleja alternifolia]|uniref:Retrotransposon gag domain-containing protein n=1 Tax=Buddleja alternifolia TaxID=168488 RepID=A0AAV6WN17_9LAMI|nr:hypothetical protein BUALT_Bualt14G0043900 [Buddleja alternifolia]